MNSGKVKQTMKKVCAGLFTAVVLFVSVNGECVQVKAADGTPVYGTEGTYEYKDEILHEEMTGIFKEVWNADSAQAVAPSKEGYVFGGWCTKDEENDTYTKLTPTTAAEAVEEESTTKVYAKFVPAYVMNVKAQVDFTTYTNGSERTNEGSIRLVSSTDSTDYQKVGFQIFLKVGTQKAEVKQDDGKPLETNKVYDKLLASAGGEPKGADVYFGTQAAYFSVWKLTGISQRSDANIIEVTPYWITPDGTKVLGNTKYVHMEDGYNDNLYVSIPVLLHEDTEGAVGIFTVTYPEGLSLIGVNPIENGNFFSDEIEYYNDTASRTIKIVGNADTVDKNEPLDGLCVNLRFKANDTVTERLNFYIENEDFSNWAEEKLGDVGAWNIQY